jgi:L-rhamnose mutarotase
MTHQHTSARKVCFLLRVKPERLAEYRERHAAVWPEMLRELQRAGRSNYSLFLRPDGLLVGYFETTADDDGDAYLAASEVAGRWEREMAPFFFDDETRPDQSIERLDQVFDLEGQLAAAGDAPAEGAGTPEGART